MRRLGEKKQRIVAGHQGCSTCQPETKGGKALERRRSEREIVEQTREVCAAKHARSEETCVLAPHSHPVHVGDYSGEGDLFTFTDADALRGIDPDVERVFGNREGVSDDVRAIFSATTPLDVTAEMKRLRDELSNLHGEMRVILETLDSALEGASRRRGPSLAPGVTAADVPEHPDYWDIHCDKCGKQLTQGWSGQEHAGCGGRFLVYGDIRKPRSTP